METSVSGETQVKITDVPPVTVVSVICTKGCVTDSVKKQRRMPNDSSPQSKPGPLKFILYKASRGENLEL